MKDGSSYARSLAGELFITRFCGCKRLKGRLVDFMEVLPLGASQTDVLGEKVNPDLLEVTRARRRSLCALWWCWVLVISIWLHGR